MKHNTFEPCKDHENGHFGWCLLCEIEQLRSELKLKNEIIEGQRENHVALSDWAKELCEKNNF